MILYKYLPPERMDVLRDASIRFTQPAALNDPFECRPLPTALADIQRVPPRDEHPECVSGHVHSLQDALTFHERQSVGLLCLSETPTSPIMWAHYAADHTGYIIGFDASNPFFQEKGASTGLWPIKYTTQRPARPKGVLEAELARHPGPHTLGLSSVFAFGEPEFTPDTQDPDYRFVKSEDWANELEWRALRPLSRSDWRLGQGNRLPVHLFSFPREAVVSVIVGCRAFSRMYPPIAEILAGHLEYSGTTLYRAELNPSTFRVELRAFAPPTHVQSLEDLSSVDLPAQVDWLLSKGILMDMEEVDTLIDPEASK